MVVLKLNKETNEWEEQPKYTRGCLEINRLHKNMLDDVKRVVQTQDRDWVCIFAGNVGDGKSTKMAQDLAYLDPTFDHTRMCQTEKDFVKQLNKMEKFQAIALDEAFDSLSSSQVSQRAHKIFVNLLQVVRQKNLFIGLSLPNFFDLNKTTAIFRSNLLVYVYSNEGQRSFFKVFDRDNKKRLYMWGKRELNDQAVYPNYRGRFNGNMPFDENKYRLAKKKAFDLKEFEKQTKSKTKQNRDKAIKKLKEEGKSNQEIADLFELNIVTIRQILRGIR